MPKRPPRVAAALTVPADLAGDGPLLAYRTASGELWRCDALELLRRLDDASVDLVIADPPYAIAKASWDEFASQEAYVAWCDDWLAEVARVLTSAGSAYVCGFSENLAEIKARSARRFAACRWLVWSYRNKANLGQDWGRSHESILHLRRSEKTRIRVDDVRVPYNGHTVKYPERVQAVSSQYGGGVRRDSWQPHPLGAKPRDVFDIPVLCNGMGEKTAHETQKPEELIEKLVLASSAPGQLVVDPFVGSGTSAVVAARLGRRWLAGDADGRYVGLARERLSSVAAVGSASFSSSMAPISAAHAPPDEPAPVSSNPAPPTTKPVLAKAKRPSSKPATARRTTATPPSATAPPTSPKPSPPRPRRKPATAQAGHARTAATPPPNPAKDSPATLPKAPQLAFALDTRPAEPTPRPPRRGRRGNARPRR